MRLPIWVKQKVVRLKETGESYTTICQILQDQDQIEISRRGLIKFYKNFKNNGGFISKPREMQGKLNQHHLDLIDDSLTANPEMTALDLAVMLKDLTGVEISVSTVKRVRRNLGWVYTKTRYCQFIRHGNKSPRYYWCLRQLRNNETFHDVIWTDESKIEVETVLGRCFRKKGHAPKLHPKPKHADSVCAYTCIQFDF